MEQSTRSDVTKIFVAVLSTYKKIFYVNAALQCYPQKNFCHHVRKKSARLIETNG